MTTKLVILLLVSSLVAAGQEPDAERGKQQPASRPIDVNNQQRQSPLPTIDLPEFVITGTASINPPNVEKDSLDESGHYKRNPLENLPRARDRETIDLGLRFKQSLFATGVERNGILTASLGTFFTPRIMGSYGVSASSYGFLTSAEYRRTRGFARHTDASLGSLRADGSLILHSPNIYFHEARLSGGTSYEIRKYRFYGSVNPSAQRSRSLFGFNLGAASAIAGPLPYHANIGYQALGLRDTTTEISENHVTIGAGSQLPVFSVPIDINLTVDLASVLGGSTSSFSLVHLDMRSPEWKWNDFVLRIVLNGYAVKGMAGQDGSYFYPDVRLSHGLTEVHRAFLGFHPSVQFSTLREMTTKYSYVSGNSVIRHANDRLAVSGGVESAWSNDLTTRVLFEFKQSTDVALYDDGSASGIGTLAYGGRTTVAAVRLDGVANITPNDYFALVVTARSSRNDVTNASVPYLPAFEISASHRHTFPFDVGVTTSVSAYGNRRTTAFADRMVGGGLWSGLKVEYDAISSLSIFLNVENLLDRNDQVWRGYTVEPLRADFGLSYRW